MLMPAPGKPTAPRTRYRRLEVRTWADDKFRRLTPMLPSGQSLWLFLLAGPHTSPIPGLFRAGRAGMAEELGWEQEAFDKAFAEVHALGMAVADFSARLVWLPKAITHNRPESPNVVRSWRVELALLPECELRTRALAALREFLESMGKPFAQAFDEAMGVAPPTKAKGSRKGRAKPSPEGLGESGTGTGAGTGEGQNPTGDGEKGDRAVREALRLEQVTQEAMDAYNATLAAPAGLLARAVLVNDARKAGVRRALPTIRSICQAEFGNERVTPKFWQLLFGAAANDPFHSGQQPGGQGHEGWRPDFDYLIRPQVIAKLFERAVSGAGVPA